MSREWSAKTMQGLQHEEKIRKCTDCDSEEIVFENGEHYCKKCGLVLD